MDERGLTHDPNRDPLDPKRWWERIGSTTKPAPYSTASWVCVQTVEKEGTVVPLPGSDPPIGLESQHIFASVKVYDRKASDPNVGGIFSYMDTDGLLIGELNYEIVGFVMTLTDWFVPQWYDSTPIEFAFKALIRHTPDCVNQVIVRKPEAFWKSLGFIEPDKNADFLVFNEKIITPTSY
jgi:hypothetical protein